MCRDFVAHGMLINVLLSMHAPEHMGETPELDVLAECTFGDSVPQAAGTRHHRVGRVTAERIVDARSEDYVERYCALDPLTSTYLGVAGHDHELPDLSPAGFEAREELTRRRTPPSRRRRRSTSASRWRATRSSSGSGWSSRSSTPASRGPR